MLEVTLTLNPRGGGPRVATIQITNDGTGTKEIGHYDVELDGAEGVQRARIEGFDRSKGHLALTCEVLKVLQNIRPAPLTTR